MTAQHCFSGEDTGIQDQRGLAGSLGAAGSRLPEAGVRAPRSGETWLPPGGQQPAPDQVEISQGKQREGAGRVLPQTSVADCHEAPEPFDHMKGMLPSRPDLRAAPIDCP